MKSSRNVMTFSRGIHPHGDGKSLSCHAAVQNVPLLEKYTVILAQNAGKPPIPVVKKGDTVKKYQLIAQADGFVSANLHSPTSGTVSNLKEVQGTMGVPAMAIEITQKVSIWKLIAVRFSISSCAIRPSLLGKNSRSWL